MKRPAFQFGHFARCAFAFAMACAAATSLAQPYPTPPPPAAPRPLAIAAPSEAKLGNGLRVIVARREGVPLVSAELVALAGAEVDPPRLSGLSSLAAELMTQGTKRHSAPELAAAAEALGGSLDSSAGWNHSTVAITVTTAKLDAALALVAEVSREPVFAADEIERVRTQTLDSLKVAYARPGTLASLVAERLAYGAGPYGHPASGTPESLPRITRDDLVAVHRRTFRPDNTVLILAGDIDAESALALARRHFGSWPVPAESAPTPLRANGATTGPAVAVVDMANSGQAGVVVALALPDRTGSERAVGAVLNSVLGGGYSSRLNQEIRIKRGLSYGASSAVDARREAGFLRIAVQTKNESAAEVVKLVQDEIDRMTKEPVGADELEARKATLIGGFSRSVETTAGLAAVVRSLVVANRAPAELKTLIEQLDAVSAEDIRRYAAAHLGAGQRRIAVAGEASVFGAALKAELPDVVTVGRDKLDLERGDGLSRR
ncbi:MAG TPA: pitrilysin family protein [Caldimonas sp.]|jgi:zinc protease|nr:pitrilysin family protein [Caldimonas sp.]HEX4235647.1 pitrilysin family protein [Caldimonas sp.]